MRFVLPPLLALLGLIVGTEGLWCDRAPHGVSVPKTLGDNGFKIVISGDPEKPDKYIPGAVYTVRLQGPGNQFTVEKFTGFLLVAEPTDGLSPEASAGNFQLTKSDSYARFSEYCPHAVKHASEVPKSEVHVQWIAPPVSQGCVSFRATIIKNKGQWFMDDGELTKTLCPETDVGEEDNEEAEPCCACDEAKYELTFEGLWSPLTHPKEFPADAWAAHFSDIVGASHSPQFRFWQQNEPASEGLRQLAEAGDSKDLERELKDESGSIRTIIKARGLRHPNFYGHKTFAVFRADKEHNMISLVSKIAPSPDWFVGVSGLNLCLRNCSWAENKVVPLYPWDAGTDGGSSYLSEKNPIIPRERISRIVWNPKPESPFYDPSGNMVKPFAKLRIVKQRAYERTCEEERSNVHHGHGHGGQPNPNELDEEEDSFEDRPECGVTPWTEWTPCSATCGKGVMHRRRQYLDHKANDMGCGRGLSQSVTCDSNVPCNGQGSGYNRGYNTNNYEGSNTNTGRHGHGSGHGRGGGDEPCAVTKWRAWGSCSNPCGQGIRRRLREFVNPSLAYSYSCANVALVENEQCYGNSRNCNEQEMLSPGCETTEWGPWEQCSAVICGAGSRTRRRMYGDPARAFSIGCNASLMESEGCMGRNPDCDQPEAKLELCMLPMDPGSCTGSYTRWYFDFHTKKCNKFKFTGCQGNANMFEKEEECERSCGSLREEGVGFGDPMLKHPSYRSKIYNPYNPQSYDERKSSLGFTSSQSPFNVNDGPLMAVTDCVVSDWGLWSKCSVECGLGHKYRIRYIKTFPQNGGSPCPKLEHRRKCTGTNCPQSTTTQKSFPSYQYGSTRYGNSNTNYGSSNNGNNNNGNSFLERYSGGPYFDGYVH